MGQDRGRHGSVGSPMDRVCQNVGPAGEYIADESGMAFHFCLKCEET
jgi:hypothetical protein